MTLFASGRVGQVVENLTGAMTRTYNSITAEKSRHGARLDPIKTRLDSLYNKYNNFVSSVYTPYVALVKANDLVKANELAAQGEKTLVALQDEMGVIAADYKTITGITTYQRIPESVTGDLLVTGLRYALIGAAVWYGGKFVLQWLESRADNEYPRDRLPQYAKRRT